MNTDIDFVLPTHSQASPITEMIGATLQACVTKPRPVFIFVAAYDPSAQWTAALSASSRADRMRRLMPQGEQPSCR